MIRILIGFLLVYGVAGGVDSMPPDPSLSYIAATITLVVVGISLMIWGVKDIQK